MAHIKTKGVNEMNNIFSKAGISYEDAIRYAVEHRIGENADDLPSAKWTWELASNGWANHVCTNCGGKINTDVHVSIDLWNCPFCGAHMENVKHTPYDDFKLLDDIQKMAFKMREMRKIADRFRNTIGGDK